MKELSIEEKAKRYDEALEKSKILYEQGTITESLCYVFPELKESEDEKIRKDIRQCIKLCSFVPSNGTSKDEMFAWLEKQGGHKPGDKAEPKFHKGDWVVLTAGELSTTLQIVSVDINKKLYWFNDSSYLPIVDEQCLHHWTIQDAKDGDVLVRNNDMLSICIFSHFDGIYNKFSSFLCHCGLEGEGLGQELSINGYHDDSKNYLPATKEQRDLLFQKMKEAGYEWDAEMKEPKKIEQNPAWSEEDDKIISEVIKNYESGFLPSVNKRDRIVKTLKSLKERVGCEANCTTMWKPSESRFSEAKEAEEADKSKT